MAVTTQQLIGRDHELERLRATLDAVRGGEPRVLAVSGEPGIGKSAVLRALRDLARASSDLDIVLAGRAAEFEEDLPFGLLVEALDEHLDGLDRTRLRGMESIADLAPIFPALHDLAPAGAPLAAERFRAHRAVRELLERLAATRPVVLVLDDLHWADPASLEVLTALLRRPPAARVLLALGFRPGRLPAKLVETLGLAERDELLERLELAPLGREDAERLLEPIVAAPLRDGVYRESGGNPFYLEQLVRAPRRHVPSGPSDVPQPIAEALAGELADLDEPTRRLLEAAAVAGEPFEPDVAAAAAETSEPAALAALDELAALGLIRPTEVPRRFQFRHPLVRRAVYVGAGSGWRLGAHARVAAALARRGAPATARAHHVEYSARPGDEAAIATLHEAGTALAARAPATAARWFRAALRLLPAEDERRGAMLRELAAAEGDAGRLDACRETLLEALAHAIDPDERLGLTVECAAVEHWLGRPGDARRRLAAALADRPADEPALQLELAFNSLYGSDLERTVALAREALTAAQAAASPEVTVGAGGLLALALAASGQAEEAGRERAQAIGVLDGLGPQASARRAEALWYLAWSATFLDQYEEGLALSRRGLEHSRATGSGRLVVPLLLAQVFPLEMLGRLEEAVEVSAEAVEAARLSGIDHHLFWAQWEHGVALLFSGRHREAQQILEESLAVSADLEPNALWASEPKWALGVCLVEIGQAERGWHLALEGVGGIGMTQVVLAERCIFYESFADAALHLGDLVEARRFAEAAMADAAQIRRPLAQVLAGRAMAAVLLAEGDGAGAAAHARAAVAAAEATDAWFEGERARVVLGRALAVAGDRDAAIAELRLAAERLEEQGAAVHRDLAARELRRLGHRAGLSAPRRATAPAPVDAAVPEALAELSAREREVAELAAAGRSNQQIADALALSRKTVETHLRAVFRKLGVASRVELAGLVARAGAEQR